MVQVKTQEIATGQQGDVNEMSVQKTFADMGCAVAFIEGWLSALDDDEYAKGKIFGRQVWYATDKNGIATIKAVVE